VLSPQQSINAAGKACVLVFVFSAAINMASTLKLGAAVGYDNLTPIHQPLVTTRSRGLSWFSKTRRDPGISRNMKNYSISGFFLKLLR